MASQSHQPQGGETSTSAHSAALSISADLPVQGFAISNQGPSSTAKDQDTESRDMMDTKAPRPPTLLAPSDDILAGGLPRDDDISTAVLLLYIYVREKWDVSPHLFQQAWTGNVQICMECHETVDTTAASSIHARHLYSDLVPFSMYALRELCCGNYAHAHDLPSAKSQGVSSDALDALVALPSFVARNRYRVFVLGAVGQKARDVTLAYRRQRRERWEWLQAQKAGKEEQGYWGEGVDTKRKDDWGWVERDWVAELPGWLLKYPRRL